MDPQYFAVASCVRITDQVVTLATPAGAEVYMVAFGQKDLESPDAEPIGVFVQYGTRKYVWRDRFWAEVEIHVSHILEKLAVRLREAATPRAAMDLRNLMDEVKLYSRSMGPVDGSGPAVPGAVFRRLLYEVDKSSPLATEVLGT